MRIAAIDRVDASGATEGWPQEYRQSPASLHAVVLVTLSVAAIGALMVPPALIALDLASKPRALVALAERPLAYALMLAGLAIGLALLSFPLRAGLSRLGRRRVVRLEPGQVSVVDTSLLQTQRWTLPFNQFCGVTHHIRASLSGTRHEIILVHPDRSKDVLLDLGHRAPELGADHYAKLLGLPEIHAKELYGRRRLPAATDKLDLQTAAAA